MTWKEIASEKGIAGNFAMQHLPGWSCWCKHPIMTLRNENETEIAKRHVTHLWPTKGSCANFLDPLSRRCAKLNRCQPTSLSFTLHQKFHWNFKRNKSEWESRHHLDLIPVEICHMQDLKNICDITIGTCTCCLVCTLHATTKCAENGKRPHRFATQSQSCFALKHWRHLGVSKAWRPQQSCNCW